MRRAGGALACLLIAAAAAAAPRTMVVQVPVADVRAEPVDSSGRLEYDPKEETQVLEGEKVLVWERRGPWSRVECVEQPEFTHHNRWEGYPGWVRTAALTLRLSKASFPVAPAAPAAALRTQVLAAASRHLGESYYWGGRSLHDASDKRAATGVDCSGLVNWSFRQIGRVVPRDAHEQFMKARRVDPDKLEPGDLFFLAKADHPDKIVHVGFIADGGDILEAPQTGDTVHRMKFSNRFGAEAATLKNGARLGDRVIYFGTFFEEAP